MAVDDVAAAEADDADDHGEDAEAEDAAESEFALEVYFDAPEEEDGDRDDFGNVSGLLRNSGIGDILRTSLRRSRIVTALKVEF